MPVILALQRLRREDWYKFKAGQVPLCSQPAWATMSDFVSKNLSTPGIIFSRDTVANLPPLHIQQHWLNSVSDPQQRPEIRMKEEGIPVEGGGG